MRGARCLPRPHATGYPLERRVMPASFCCCSCSAPRVENVHLREDRRRTTVAHRVALSRLTLRVTEGASQVIAARPADHLHRSPELRRAELIRDVLQHADDLAAFDLVEDLPCELPIVALLVDRERAVADDGDALIHLRDEIVPRVVARAGLDRHVRHALKLDVTPALRV